MTTECTTYNISGVTYDYNGIQIPIDTICICEPVSRNSGIYTAEVNDITVYSVTTPYPEPVPESDGDTGSLDLVDLGGKIIDLIPVAVKSGNTELINAIKSLSVFYQDRVLELANTSYSPTHPIVQHLLAFNTLIDALCTLYFGAPDNR